MFVIEKIQLLEGLVKNFGGAPMDYVNLVQTGLKVSRICLGTMGYGSPKWRHWVLD
jgi:hypothetical protein